MSEQDQADVVEVSLSGESIIKAGDRMRMSVELVQEIHRQPLNMTRLIEVAEIRVDHDGTKCIWVKNAD